MRRPIRVAVLVDLIWRPEAGGHVKCWERIGRAATHRDDIDLTVHFSGPEEDVVELSDNVRFHIHRPILSTARLPFLGRIPDHTDLSPHHPRLARCLSQVDVIHTTDAFFAFARTAARFARRQAVPLVNSVHTDTPSYTRVFTGEIIERMFGTGLGARIMLGWLRLDRRLEQRMQRKLERHQRGAVHCLVATETECNRLRLLHPDRSIHVLRRGIDRSQFNPAHRDRAWLHETYGVPTNRVVVLFVGRLDSGKRVLTLATAVRDIAAASHPIHLFCAGDGPDRDSVRQLLGLRCTAPGFVPAVLMPKVFASADILAMPSEIEVFANVVQEAMASATVPVVSSKSQMGRVLEHGRSGLVVEGGNAEAWAAALEDLVRDPARIEAMGREARRAAETSLPSWDDVLADDLMPLWRGAAASRASAVAA